MFFFDFHLGDQVGSLGRSWWMILVQFWIEYRHVSKSWERIVTVILMFLCCNPIALVPYVGGRMNQDIDVTKVPDCISILRYFEAFGFFTRRLEFAASSPKMLPIFQGAWNFQLLSTSLGGSNNSNVWCAFEGFLLKKVHCLVSVICIYIYTYNDDSLFSIILPKVPSHSDPDSPIPFPMPPRNSWP